ncbi:MAG: cytochrome c [Deltaproteobacteria bacterium]|nr:MAG: cytochrome c [Deltaproteobacteria bacterium]
MMRATRLVAVVVATGAAAAACDASGERPAIVVSPDMAFSIPYDPYDPNPNTPTGQTLLAPPEGTMPVDGEWFPYGAGRDEQARAGRELTNPIPADRAEIQRGKHVFDTFCAVCHGAGGAGDGTVIGTGRFPNPPSLVADHARGLPDGALYHIITKGQGIMPSYAVQVRPADRWRAIRYIRTLQGGGK